RSQRARQTGRSRRRPGTRAPGVQARRTSLPGRPRLRLRQRREELHEDSLSVAGLEAAMYRARSLHLVVLVLAAAAGLLASSLWTQASILPVSREALASSFDANIRHLVYAWDPGDPRSE